ncbi:hypothetical protein KQI84_03555 [bacterium]|nr:hypothetical protein [bacterium]
MRRRSLGRILHGLSLFAAFTTAGMIILRFPEAFSRHRDILGYVAGLLFCIPIIFWIRARLFRSTIRHVICHAARGEGEGNGLFQLLVEGREDDDVPIASPTQIWLNTIAPCLRDTCLNSALTKWLWKQPTPVDFHGFLQRVHDAYEKTHPIRHICWPSSNGLPTVFFVRENMLHDASSLPTEVYRWRSLLSPPGGAEGDADTMLLDLSGIDEERSRGEWEDWWRQYREVVERKGLSVYPSRRRQVEAMKEAACDLGIESKWPAIVPLRHYAGDALVNETLLTIPEALEFRDDALLRFDICPWPLRSCRGEGHASLNDDSGSYQPLSIAYEPGKYLRICATGAPYKEAPTES